MKYHVFISYGHEDAYSARRIYRELRQEGYEVWLDRESLLPGQKWKDTIIQAIRDSRFFLALLSPSSVSRRGFVNKEIAEALDVLDQYPESDVFLIPVRLNKCEPSHPRLNDIHRVDMFPSWKEGMRQIKKALELSRSRSLDFPTGRHIQAYVQIKLKGKGYQKLLKNLRILPNVQQVKAIYGHYDFMVFLDAEDITCLHRTLLKIGSIPGVLETSTQIVIQSIHPDERA